MSGGLSIYAVDVAALRALFSTENTSVLASTTEARGIASLLAGGTPTQEIYEYYADLETLVRRLGVQLGTQACAPTNLAMLDAVEKAIPDSLRAAGLSFARLYSGGAPIRLPLPDDFPMVGYLEADTVRAWRALVEATPLESSDPDVDSVFVELEGWLEIARARGHGLVAFYQ